MPPPDTETPRSAIDHLETDTCHNMIIDIPLGTQSSLLMELSHDGKFMELVARLNHSPGTKTLTHYKLTTITGIVFLQIVNTFPPICPVALFQDGTNKSPLHLQNSQDLARASRYHLSGRRQHGRKRQSSRPNVGKKHVKRSDRAQFI